MTGTSGRSLSVKLHKGTPAFALNALGWLKKNVKTMVNDTPKNTLTTRVTAITWQTRLYTLIACLF
jgi:hypothetical protein